MRFLSMSMDLTEGQIIRADFFNGPAEVKKFEKRARYYKPEIVLQETGVFRSLNPTPDQLAQIELVDREPEILSGNLEEFFLNIEAHRIRLAHQFAPMLAVSVSQVDPLPHQIEAVYHHALEMPHLRFLIADDAGTETMICYVETG